MMVKSCALGKKPSETLRRVARYYMDTCGTSPEATRKKLDLFLLQCDPTASLPKWSAALDYAVSRASKYPAICIDSIPITDAEMKKIDSLKIKQHRRLAFTLLCLSKYWGMVTGKNDGWVNTKDNEIMSMANIRTSIKRQSAMYGTLCELGFIQFSLLFFAYAVILGFFLLSFLNLFFAVTKKRAKPVSNTAITRRNFVVRLAFWIPLVTLPAKDSS